jgi:hypothetical protein
MQMSVQVHAPIALPREECVPDIQSQSENFGEEKNFLPLGEIELEFLGFETRSPVDRKHDKQK